LEKPKEQVSQICSSQGLVGILEERSSFVLFPKTRATLEKPKEQVSQICSSQGLVGILEERSSFVLFPKVEVHVLAKLFSERQIRRYQADRPLVAHYVLCVLS
jgi:hypothetical protein